MMTFVEFFKEIWGEDKDPFPWQEELAARAMEGSWPSCVGLPTAAGKTALIDIAVFALGLGAPNAARRIFFVVDRRVIVDEAADRAQKLADKLAEASPNSGLGKLAQRLREVGRSQTPLTTATLRGGVPRDDSWTDSPLQPVVICSTVDQIGSSLLFRAYGASEYARPIRAGLAAHDALVILDEAHTSQPFAETLQWISRYRGWAEEPIASPFTVVEMSATPRDKEVFHESEGDLRNTILKRRWEAEKHAKLVLEESEAEGGDEHGPLVRRLVREARALRDERGARVVGVIANRVRTARRVHDDLSEDKDSECILLTGRARPWDRDQLWRKWKTRIGIGHASPDHAIFVVATQCIEVGADIDFDGLVTELASIDALEQRFGRLARDGSDDVRHAAIVARKRHVAKTYVDPVYREALGAVWKWLKEHAQKEKRAERVPGKKARTKTISDEFVDMGALALRRALQRTKNRESLTMPPRNAPILLPAHIDLLCQTSPEPAISPEPAVFLHGPESGPADIQVVWRQDLDERQDLEVWADIVAICPPNPAEAIALPVWEVRKWLSGESTTDLADIEGAPGEATSGGTAMRTVLDWRGPDASEVIINPEKIRPGMTIVVPTEYGGCDKWGWNPASTAEVTDIGDAVKLQADRTILRLHPKLAERWNYPTLAQRIRDAESAADARTALTEALELNLEDWVKAAVARLIEKSAKLVDNPADDGAIWAALVAKGTFAQESTRASYTIEVPLTEHLAGCGELATDFARGLAEPIRKVVVRAAELHDIGKADPRFQAWLRGGNAVKLNDLLAKSGRSGQNQQAINRARELAHYPKGGRHELMSVALLLPHEKEFQELDFDLLLHLVGSHHGRCRPFSPVVEDGKAVLVAFESWTASSDHRLERAGSGISERFWRLNRRYGWYGLAFLETLVRLADQRQSEREQETQSEVAAHA